MGTGEIEVAHRGTEVKTIPGLVIDLAYTDGSIVLRKVNPQADDAIGSICCTFIDNRIFQH